jgi:hypothetical protein
VGVISGSRMGFWLCGMLRMSFSVNKAWFSRYCWVRLKCMSGLVGFRGVEWFMLKADLASSFLMFKEG